MSELLPLFLDLTSRRVVLVGGGSVATAKLHQLLAAHADVRVVAPDISAGIRATAVPVAARPFVPSDLDGAWLAVAAATPDVNRAVAEAANERRMFVNAVDDPVNASAFMGGVLRRGDVTIAVSTSGQAPALASLVREGLDTIVPVDVAAWAEHASHEREVWRAERLPIGERKPRLLRALNELYGAGEKTRLGP
jgi:uroporphyrin-III C-methyltransferase / precorrin-2 dehydrogenase / sirohydrochlorin ferrochelatase